MEIYTLSPPTTMTDPPATTTTAGTTSKLTGYMYVFLAGLYDSQSQHDFLERSLLGRPNERYPWFQLVHLLASSIDSHAVVSTLLHSASLPVHSHGRLYCCSTARLLRCHRISQRFVDRVYYKLSLTLVDDVSFVGRGETLRDVLARIAFCSAER